MTHGTIRAGALGMALTGILGSLPAEASTFWAPVRIERFTPSLVDARSGRILDGNDHSGWEIPLRAGRPVTLLFSFEREEMLKGVRIVSGPLPAGVRYRIETSRDGQYYLRCQEETGPKSTGLSGVGFDVMEPKALARYVRVTLESKRGLRVLRLNELQVFAED